MHASRRPSSISERRILNVACHLLPSTLKFITHEALFRIFDFLPHPSLPKMSLKWLHCTSHYFMSEMKKTRRMEGCWMGQRKWKEMIRVKFKNDVDEYFTSKKGNIFFTLAVFIFHKKYFYIPFSVTFINFNFITTSRYSTRKLFIKWSFVFLLLIFLFSFYCDLKLRKMFSSSSTCSTRESEMWKKRKLTDKAGR